MILQLFLACGPCSGGEADDLGAWADVTLPERSYVCSNAYYKPNERITVRSRSLTEVLEADMDQALADAGWTRLDLSPGTR